MYTVNSAAHTLVELDEADLLSLAAAGHEPAFSQLYRRHSASVARLVYALFGTRHHFEQVMLDTFVAARTALADVEDVAELRPWLVKTAIFEARRRYGSGNVDDPLADALWKRLPRISDPAASTLAEAMQHELGRLPDKLRVPWMLHVIGGLGPSLIGDLTEQRRETVARRIAAASKKLSKRKITPEVVALVCESVDTPWHDLAQMRVLNRLRKLPLDPRLPAPRRPRLVPAPAGRSSWSVPKPLRWMGLGAASGGLFALGWWLSTLVWPLLDA